MKSIRKVVFTDGQKSNERAREEHLSERRILYPREYINRRIYNQRTEDRAEQSKSLLLLLLRESQVRKKASRSRSQREELGLYTLNVNDGSAAGKKFKKDTHFQHVYMRSSRIESFGGCCSRDSFYSRASFSLSAASRFFLRTPTIQTTTVCLLLLPHHRHHHQQNRFAKGEKISISSETKKLKSRRGTKETKVGAQRVPTTMGVGSENEDDANRFESAVTFRENLLRWYDAEKRSLPWRKRGQSDASKFEHFGGDKEEEEELEEDATKAFERWQRLASSPSSSSSREKETSSSAPTPTGGSHTNNNSSSINKSSAADADDWREKRVMSDDQYAYGVWVSEIMSQQTQIERVAEYWSRWVKKWPTVRHLANASEEEVREMWAGLGYYRRSQFLLKGAKYVSEELKGRFPRDIIGLLKIPGIGPYTASAVGSIAFGIREAAIDGNVNRVLTRVRRIRGDPVKEKNTVDAIKRVAWELIGKEEEKEDEDDDEKKEDAKSKNRPGDFNQAMMELGATVCKPKNPSCNACPISAFCEGYQHELLSDGQEPVTAYPEIAKKAEKRQEAIAVAVVSCTFENTKWFYLTKRPENGLLADMWEFPSVFMREGELAMRSVPSDADVCDAQKFFRESDARGVSELFASVASPPCDTNNEGEEKSEVKKTEKRKQTDRRQDSLTFKHEPGVVAHVFSHVKHFMHVFTLDLGTVDALPRRRAKKEEEKENASNEQKETTTNGRRNSSLSSSSTSSSSSWFRSSDFEDKGVFSTGVQKVFAFAEKRGKHESSGDIRKRSAKSHPSPPSHPFDAGGVAEKAKKDTLLLKDDDALGVENENETKKTKKTTMKKKIKIETKDIETYFTRAV